MLEDALPEVTGEKECIGPTATQGGKESEMRNADVLRLVHDREVEYHILVVRECCGQGGEKLRVRDQLAACNPARTRSKMDHKTTRCASGNRVFLPRRTTSR